MLTHIIFHR